MKKILVSLLIILPLMASADSVEIDGIYYNLSSEAEVTGNPNMYVGDILIPESVTLDGVTYSVTSIGNGAFYGCHDLASVVIPKSATSIGQDAFRSCNKLTSISIPSSVTIIGVGAFKDCNNLTSVTSLSSIHSIEALVFQGCTSLTSVIIPNSVTSIGLEAFEGCSSLTSVSIPESVTYVRDDAFKGTPWYDNQPDGIVYVGKALYRYKGNMPDGTNITIADGTIHISDKAFYHCKELTSVTIPNSVKEIGHYAFEGCSGLTAINIPNSVAEIGVRAFYGCIGLSSIEIPNSVTKIGWGAFLFCSGLTSVTIPNSITEIDNSTFNGCSGLISVTIPSSVTIIRCHAFQDCSGLTSVHISDLEAWCNLSFHYFNTNPLQYAHHLFLNGEEIKDLMIPNGVTRIGSLLFYGCSGLTSVMIPNSVTSIEDGTFGKCDMSEVFSKIEDPFVINTSTFSENTYYYATLYVPVGTIDKYKTTEGWKDFNNIVESDLSGINKVVFDNNIGSTPVYDLYGRRLSQSQKGINIIRQNDGTIKKVLVK